MSVPTNFIQIGSAGVHTSTPGVVLGGTPAQAGGIVALGPGGVLDISVIPLPLVAATVSYAPMVNGDTPGPSFMYDPNGQPIFAILGGGA
jgi:hypothetical protein